MSDLARKSGIKVSHITTSTKVGKLLICNGGADLKTERDGHLPRYLTDLHYKKSQV